MGSRRGWVLLMLSLVLTGCLNSYVVPLLPHVTYEELLATRNARPVVLTVAFQRNGAPYERATKVLTTAKVFSVVRVERVENADELKIILNNVGDVGDAFGKGALTGLTFGAAGSTVTDGYVMTATFTRAGQPPVEKVYRHALLSTVGNAKGPEGLKPMGLTEAFDQVVQDLVLNLILDLQKAELL
jgi:hypothetical protein